MKRPTRTASLADYTTPRTVIIGSQDWTTIAAWQRAGLVSVRLANKDTATVTLTDKGRAEVASC